MDFTPDREKLLKKMFEAALKEKLNLLARRYDYALVFELWTQIMKIGAVQTYFCKWGWTPNMTIAEALDCLDDYCNGLEAQLQESQAMRNSKQQEN